MTILGRRGGFKSGKFYEANKGRPLIPVESGSYSVVNQMNSSAATVCNKPTARP